MCWLSISKKDDQRSKLDLLLDGVSVIKGRQDSAVDVGRSRSLHLINKLFSPLDGSRGDWVSENVIIFSKRSLGYFLYERLR